MSRTRIVSSGGSQPQQPRGRPRSAHKNTAILNTALEILQSEGYSALSLAKVASMSGMARPTIKLRWTDKEQLAVAVIKRMFDERPVTATSIAQHHMSNRDKIRLVLEDLVAMMSETGTARVVSAVVAAAHFSEPMSELRQYVLARRGTVLRGLMVDGIASGEFSNELDVERALDALNGPVLYRLLITGLSVDADDIEYILNMVLGATSSQ